MRSNTICRNYVNRYCSYGKFCHRIHPVDRDFYYQEHLRRQADNSPVEAENDSVSEHGHTFGYVGASSNGPTRPRVKLPSSESRRAPNWDSNTGQWVSGLNNTVWNDSGNSSDEGGADSSVNYLFSFFCKLVSPFLNSSFRLLVLVSLVRHWLAMKRSSARHVHVPLKDARIGCTVGAFGAIPVTMCTKTSSTTMNR